MLFVVALPVGEAAGSGRDVFALPGVAVVGVDDVDGSGDFTAIGTDVLHGGGADAAGNGGKVFDAVPVLRRRPGDEVIPALASGNAQVEMFWVFAGDLPPGVTRAEQALAHFRAKDDVAAAAEDAVAGGGNAPFVGVVDVDEFARGGGAGEGVARGEVGVVFGLHGQVGACCLRLALYVHHARASPPCI